MLLPIVWHPGYEVDIGPHVFPTNKYRLVRDRLLEDGTTCEAAIRQPEPATDREVGLVHTPEYLAKIRHDQLTPDDELRLELPFSPGLRRASWLCAGGSILTARLALEGGVAAHLGGGFHHAFPDHGEGFCLINDVAIAVQVLRHEGRVGRAMVVDCDVHQGNGTAAVFATEADVFTYSMHQEANYPPWKPPSDLDVGLEDQIGDADYLAQLEQTLAPAVQHHEPELAVYLAGADPYVFDQLGGLGLTLAGLRQRDELVLEILRDRSTAVAIVLAGGYARRLEETVEIHCATIRAAKTALDEERP